MAKKKQSRQPIWKDITNNNGMYGVVRKPSGAKRAHFVCLHETHDSAEAEAVRLLTEVTQANPEKDHTFFVIQIVGYVGFVGGKFIGDSIEQ